MNTKKNYYSILGVDKNSDDKDIKTAFRNLSKQHHPDKGGDAEKFKEINEAYTILSDTKQRNQYDLSSSHGKNYNPNSNPFEGFGNPFGGGFTTDFGFNIDELLRQSGFRSNFRQEVYEDLDIELKIEIPLKDIYNNTPREFTYMRNSSCNTCNGTGEVKMQGHVNCHHCNGKGRIKNSNNTESICTNCGGTGKIDKKVCPDCNGNKVKLKKETLPLTNLFVLGDSARTIVYNGYGHKSKHYKDRAGKLILNLYPLGDNKYKKSGFDLHYTVQIDYKTAILGGNFEYEHLDGKTYSIKIPEKTNNKTKFALKEKGMMINQQGNRGNLFIEVELFIDYSKIKDVDIELLKKLN